VRVHIFSTCVGSAGEPCSLVFEWNLVYIEFTPVVCFPTSRRGISTAPARFIVIASFSPIVFFTDTFKAKIAFFVEK